MAVDQQYEPLRTFHPRWPDRRAVDPGLLVFNYWHEIDTLMVDFTGQNPPAVSVPLDLGGERGYFFLRLDPVTEEVVGLQIEDFLHYAVHRHPYLLDALDLAMLHGITRAAIARVDQSLAPKADKRAVTDALFDELRPIGT